jgi:DnaJ-class molecular chaperone
MSKFTHNTEDWELHAFLDWRAKKHPEDCDDCGGCGEVGGGLGDLDGARQCYNCHGSGVILKDPTTQHPEIPPALVEHMRRAWWDYHNPKE